MACHLGEGRRGGLSLWNHIVVVELLAKRSVGCDLGIADPEIGVGRVVAHTVFARATLNLRNALAAEALISGKRGRYDRAIRAREDRRECHSVFYGLIGALPEMGKHRVRGVAQKRQPATRPGRKWLAIIQGPSKCHLDLPQKRLDARIPTGKFAAQHTGISG